MIRVKICGITRVDDALDAARAGADFLGFVFAPSPRRVDPGVARAIGERLASEHPDVGRVGVFVDPREDELARVAAEANLTHLQIHGRAPVRRPAGLPWIAAIGLASPADAVRPAGDPWAVLAEPRVEGRTGGSGRPFPWEWARPLLDGGRVFIAGGLDAGVVPSLLRVCVPYGVDASSRLERSPGVKDPQKVAAFIEAVRAHGA